jgi:hypothetical protein
VSGLLDLAVGAVEAGIKVAMEAAANAGAEEAAILARLAAVLSGAVAFVDSKLAEMDAARVKADAEIAAAGPVE